jgi:hypothetical protein
VNGFVARIDEMGHGAGSRPCRGKVAGERLRRAGQRFTSSARPWVNWMCETSLRHRLPHTSIAR